MKFNYMVFETINKKYLYDGVSTNIFEVSENFYRSHREWIASIEHGADEYQSYPDYSTVVEAIENGFFIPLQDKTLSYWFDEQAYIECVARKEIKHVMVEVTQDCNMRCKYCIYGGHYPMERRHGKQSMNEQTLINAARLILDGSPPFSEKIFNFYGGEPFLAFNKIASVIEKVIAIDPQIKYYFTTNGTLINRRIAEWFVGRPQVNLFVSFGGGPLVHDRLRVTKNGSATYQLVRNNLLAIKELSEEAYASRVRFIFNIFTSKQLFDIDELYRTDPIFSTLKEPPEITLIDSTADDGVIARMQEEFEEAYKDHPDPIDEYIRRLEAGDAENVFSKYFDDLFLTIHRRGSAAKNSIISGVCRPFLNKVFVDVNGEIHVCENYRSGEDFGNVNSKIKLEKIMPLLQHYKSARSNACPTCWANKLCSLCFKDFGNRETHNLAHNNLACCEAQRQRLKDIFIEYCQIMEKNPDILDHLDLYDITE